MCFGILVIGRRAKCNPTVAELKRTPRCRRSGKPAELKRPPACRTITAVVEVHELWDPLLHMTPGAGGLESRRSSTARRRAGRE